MKANKLIIAALAIALLFSVAVQDLGREDQATRQTITVSK